MSPVQRRCPATNAARSAAGATVVAFSAALSGAVWADGYGCVPHEAVPDQVVVELEDSTSISEVLAAIQPQFPGVRVLVALPGGESFLLSAPEPICEQALVNALQALPGVEAEFNESGESSIGQTQSFFFAGLSGADFTDQYSWPLVGLDAAHTVATGAGLVVAIIDSGLDVTHPLLADATVLPGADYVGDNAGFADVGDGIDNDGDGAIDEMAGHGTFVAGLIHTIAPDAAILPLRVMNSDGVGSEFAVAGALLEAKARGADVVNLSFVSQQPSGLLSSIINQLVANGTVVVVAAGNLGSKNSPPFPAGMASICAVASTGPNDVVPPWSNLGSFVDVCAPGIDVVSSLPGDQYAYASGTSVSTAFATGAALLVRSTYPRYTVSDVVATLRNTATSIDSVNPGCAGLLGGGRIDLAAAVGVVSNPADLDGDGAVNAIDLGLLIGAWGSPNADLSGDGTTDAVDLGILIGAWTG
ncbi:MAG: S8 family serine peptidase [Phycisphaerales bacterium]